MPVIVSHCQSDCPKSGFTDLKVQQNASVMSNVLPHVYVCVCVFGLVDSTDTIYVFVNKKASIGSARQSHGKFAVGSYGRLIPRILPSFDFI